MKKPKKPTTKNVIDKVCKEISDKLRDIENDINEFNDSGMRTDTPIMRKEPSPLYENKEEAQAAMDDPGVELAIQHVKDIIDKNLRR